MEKTKITILGSGTCVPSIYRSSCAVLIETGRAKILLLTHFYPCCENKDIAGMCQKEYTGDIITAVDLMRIKL